MLFNKTKPPVRKVRVQVIRQEKKRWLIGTVIGTKSFVRDNSSPLGQIFNMQPVRTWNEDKLLIKLSNGSFATAWDSDVFEVVS